MHQKPTRVVVYMYLWYSCNDMSHHLNVSCLHTEVFSKSDLYTMLLYNYIAYIFIRFINKNHNKW